MATRIDCRSAEGDADRLLATIPGRFDERRFLRMLGLSPSPNPVMIIKAAQVRLRRWRRGPGGQSIDFRNASNRIQRIKEARDTLLRHACRAEARPPRPTVALARTAD